MRQFALSLQVLLLLSPFSHAQSIPDPLIRFLQDYVGSSGGSKTTEYSAVLVDLKDDGTKEAIVYFSSNGWCGTGGCTMLILVPEVPLMEWCPKSQPCGSRSGFLARKQTDGTILACLGGEGVLSLCVRPSFPSMASPIHTCLIELSCMERLGARLSGQQRRSPSVCTTRASQLTLLGHFTSEQKKTISLTVDERNRDFSSIDR